MFATFAFLALLNIASAGRYGFELGNLYNGSSASNHGVRGNVSVLNEVTFYIANFSYDGNAPDAYFWVGKTATPSNNGFIVPDELGTKLPLKKYENRSIVISLPENLKISDIKWLSVWCRTYAANFGYVTIPDGFEPPKPKALPPLLGVAHGVGSGGIILIDSKTMQINNLHYDGNGPDAFFLVGTGGKPNGKGIKVPDENGRLSRLRGYNGENIALRLPDPYTWFDIKWFAMYCIMAQQNFGDVSINPPLNIPIDLSSLPQTEDSPTLTNCQEIFADRLLVRWMIEDEDIYIQLEGRTNHKEYLAFGISGSEEAAQMVGADVVVTFYDDEKSIVVADDYYITEKAQCAGGRGACPDVNQGGRQNIVVVDWRRENGILTVTYKRRLESTEVTDKPIYENGSTTVVAAIGLINSKMEAAKHSRVTGDLLKIEFGKDAKRCSTLEVITVPPPIVRPWPALTILNETIFTAQIGPTGNERGYTAITGNVGWGIAWWINGLLIPEITVNRGVKYTFITEGGNDPSNSAQYHPFYITNSVKGGGAHESDVGTPAHMVYAGVKRDDESGRFIPIGVGRYCSYETETKGGSDDFETFEEFRGTLELRCENGSSGEFTWTPDRDTPDLVYYQCFTHRHLGWKIHVTGETGAAARTFVFTEWILACLVYFVLSVN